MSDPNESLKGGSDKSAKRNLPSWMSTTADVNKFDGEDVGNSSRKTIKQSLERDHQQNERTRKSLPTNSGASNFSKLLEGVVFVLSGFVNPERSVLRSQALEMGAEYQADWNSNCTLLICAFPNTPKFRQVEADCGTIVSKEWISECHSQKKLIDIDSYLMHAGKPWRKQNDSFKASQEPQSPAPKRSPKKMERGSQTKSTSKKSEVTKPARFALSKVKNWAVDDLNNTISWLESQEEKPEASEIKKIASEGILTCLQDAIDSLKESQDIQQIIEQWNFIPRAVEELAKLDDTANGKGKPLLSKEELCKEATTFKRIYEAELSTLNKDSMDKKRPRTDSSKKGDYDYDSDATIEMTEDEIDLAFNNVASSLTRR